MGAQDAARPLVEPLRRNAGNAGRGSSSLHAPLIHAHAVGHLLAGRMHRLTVGGAPDVAETRAADHAACGFTGMIDRGENAPRRLARIDTGIVERLRREVSFSCFSESDTGAQCSHRQIVHGSITAEQANPLPLHYAEAPPSGPLSWISRMVITRSGESATRHAGAA